MDRKMEKLERFTLESPKALGQWRQTLQLKSPRIGAKLQTIKKLEDKLAKRLQVLNQTLAEEPMFVIEKSPKKVNHGPIRTLAEINTFHPSPESQDPSSLSSSSSSSIASTTTNFAADTVFSKKEKDLKCDIEYHQDEELGFDLAIGNEGVYVSALNDKGRSKGVPLYSTLHALKNQNVSSFELDKMKKALSTLTRPARITFRKSIVETPYGIAHIVNRHCTNHKVQVLLEYGTAFLTEDDITKFIPNKQWNEFEEDRLSELIQNYTSSQSRGSSRMGMRKKSRPQTSSRSIKWDKIADEMHGRSSKDCEKRWELISTLNHIVNEDVLYNKLAYFSRKGDPQSLKRIIQRCPELLQRPDKNRSTPLFTACWYGKYEICKLMIQFGAKVNHSNLKGNYPIHMAIENNFSQIVDLLIAHDAKVTIQDVYNIIDKNSAYTPHPDVVLSINRAQLESGDKVWYEHTQLGLIRAVVMDKLSDLRPVHYTIKMRINQYHEAAMSKKGTTIARVKRVSVLDKRLKPMTESTGPPLKELIVKKQKMMERFNKWDSFWSDWNVQNHRGHLTRNDPAIDSEDKNSIDLKSKEMSKEMKSSKSKMVIISGNQLPFLMEEDGNESGLEEGEENGLEIDNGSEIEEEEEEYDMKDDGINNTDHGIKQSNVQNSKSTTDTFKQIAVWTPFQRPVTHNNYYLKHLKEVALANRCVGLRKLQDSISQHPDTKEHEYEQNIESNSNQNGSKNTMCYVAREHAKRFEMVMDKLIDYAI